MSLWDGLQTKERKKNKRPFTFDEKKMLWDGLREDNKELLQEGFREEQILRKLEEKMIKENKIKKLEGDVDYHIETNLRTFFFKDLY